MTYNVDHFINKFEAIPEDKVISFSRNDGSGGHCAHGWCDLEDKGISDEEIGLMEVFSAIGCGDGIASINNGRDERYPQPTPRLRILAALHDIKAMQAVQIDPLMAECLSNIETKGGPY